MNAQRQELERLLAEEEALLGELEQRQAGAGAPPSGPTTADLMARSQLPSQEQAQQQSLAMGGEANQALGEQLDVSKTHYQTLFPRLGTPTEEENAAYRQSVIDMAATTGGGAIGRGLTSRAADAAKFLGRGFMTEPGAGRFLAREGQHVAEGAGGSIVRELFGLFSPVVGGAMIGGAVDYADPSRITGTKSEFIDNPVAAGTGVATAGGVAALTMRDLMIQDPRWREVMQRPSRGTYGALLGAALGYLASKAVEATPELVDALRQEISGMLGGGAGETPGPQAGATDMPPRAVLPQVPDQSQMLAQRLMLS